MHQAMFLGSVHKPMVGANGFESSGSEGIALGVTTRPPKELSALPATADEAGEPQKGKSRSVFFWGEGIDGHRSPFDRLV